MPASPSIDMGCAGVRMNGGLIPVNPVPYKFTLYIDRTTTPKIDLNNKLRNTLCFFFSIYTTPFDLYNLVNPFSGGCSQFLPSYAFSPSMRWKV